MSRDKSSGSVLGPQDRPERLFDAEEMKQDLKSMEKTMFSPKKVALEENEALGTKDTGRKCVVCGGAIVEREYLESHLGPRRLMRYCQNCEILYR